ncbi:hypothetical protein GCM10027417_11970 [Glutamicibacter endophyticus]
MTDVENPRFAIDAATALRIVREDPGIGARHQLVGPGVLRSHVLSMLYSEVREELLNESTARTQLESLSSLKIRLLSDRVSRATAWKLAVQLGWDDTTLAEYLAVATLQADALITVDPVLAVAARGIIPLAAYGDLLS